MNRTRGAIGSLALAALLGVTLAGSPVRSIAAQDTTETPATTTESQTQADADAAALATGKYPFGTMLMLLEGQGNVLQNAGSESATLTQIEEGDIVTVQAGPEQVGGADWYQVETAGGITGWVDASKFGIAKGAPVIPTGSERQVATESLNLRSEPGTSSDVISGLVQGDTVTIVSGPEVSGELDWYEVQTAYGEDGWLAAVYLGTPGSASVGAQTTGDTATPTTTAATPVAPAAQTAAAADGFPNGSYVFIDGDGEAVNLRAEASTDSDIVAELADGSVGTVTGASTTGGDYTWYPVSFGTGDATQTGFVAGDFLTGGITVGQSALVAQGPLNVREDTNTDGDPIASLEQGAQVTVVAGPTDVDGVAWFEIQSGDTNGYVSGRYLGLKVIEDTEEATTDETATDATATDETATDDTATDDTTTEDTTGADTTDDSPTA